MSKKHEDFGALRSLLAQPPSVLGWRTLCDLFNRAWAHAPRETEQRWLPYAHQHLQSWPDRLRVASDSWVDSLMLPRSIELLRLARVLEIRHAHTLRPLWLGLSKNAQRHEIRFIQIDLPHRNDFMTLDPNTFSGVSLPGVQGLRLSQAWSTSSMMRRLLRTLPRLRALGLDAISCSGILGDPGAAVMPDGVVDLSLDDRSINTDVLWEWSEVSTWQHTLERLSVRGATLDWDSVLPLERMRRLSVLDIGDTFLCTESKWSHNILTELPMLRQLHVTQRAAEDPDEFLDAPLWLT